MVYLSVHVWKSLYVAVRELDLHAVIHWSRWLENAPWRYNRLGTVQKVSVSHFGTTRRPAECQRRNVSQFSAQQCRLRWRLRVTWRKDDMHVIYAYPARVWLFGDLLRNCEHFKFVSLSVQLFFCRAMTSLRMERQFWRSDVTRGKLLQNWYWSIITLFSKRKLTKCADYRPWGML